MNQALRTYGCQKLTFLKFLIIISSFLKITNNHTKKDFVVQNPYFIPMVPSRRLERLTYGLEGSCSIQLSYEGR